MAPRSAHSVHSRARRALARRANGTTESWLSEKLAQARVDDPAERACEVMLLLEGAMALTLIHGHRRYIDAAARAARRLAAQRQRRVA